MNFLSSSKSMKAFSVQLNKYFKYGSGIIYGTKTKAETPSRSFRSVGASHPIPRLYHSIYLNYGSKRDRIKVLKLVIDRSFWGQMENAHGRGIFSPFHVVILFTHSLVSNSLWPLGLQRTRLFCSWNFPSNNTGVGCHFLLQRIFMTQGSNPHLRHWQMDSPALWHLESPNCF